MLVRMWTKGNTCELLVGIYVLQQLSKTIWRFLKTLKIHILYDPAIPRLGIYPKKIKALTWKDICTPIFTAALSTIAKIWNQPKFLSTDEWIRQMWYLYLYIYIYIQWILSVIRKKKILPFSTLSTLGKLCWDKSKREWKILCDIIYL